MGGIGIWQLLIVAVIVVLLFGTKKLRGLGSDLGSAIKGFKSAVSDEEKPVETITEKKEADSAVDSAKVTEKKKDQA
jgi:sec-independent protein translocase protein TatA